MDDFNLDIWNLEVQLLASVYTTLSPFRRYDGMDEEWNGEYYFHSNPLLEWRREFNRNA